MPSNKKAFFSAHKEIKEKIFQYSADVRSLRQFPAISLRRKLNFDVIMSKVND